MSNNGNELAVAYRMRGLEPRYEHPFYTYSHIYDQADIIDETIEWLEKPIKDLVEKHQDLKKVYLCGVGSSQNVALIGAQYLGYMAQIEAEGFDSYDWTRSTLYRNMDGAAILAYTASGASPEVLTAMELLDRQKAWTLGVTNTPDSRLATLCNDTIVAPGGTRYIVDFFSRVTATYMFSNFLGDPEKRESRMEKLRGISAKVRESIASIDKKIEEIGKEWADKRAVYCLGSGMTYPVALDTAMRFDECSIIPAKGLTVSQYIHGSIGCSSPEEAIIIFAPEGPGFRRLLDAAMIAHKVGMSVVFITNEENHQADEYADHIIRVPSVDMELIPYMYAPAGQLLAYYVECARENGNPDIRRTNQPNYAEAFDFAFRDWEGE